VSSAPEGHREELLVAVPDELGVARRGRRGGGVDRGRGAQL